MKALDILYDDANLVIVNKPAGISVIPERFDNSQSSINQLLSEQLGCRIWVVHRLDKDTSGALCFAKNEDSHRLLSLQFEKHEAQKWYLGLCKGHWTPQAGIIESNIAESPSQKGKMMVHKNGKKCTTGYETLGEYSRYSWMKFQLFTGRTHQIRVHAAHSGHPLVADPLYGDGQGFLLSSIKKNYKLPLAELEERPLLNRLALHASQLILSDQHGKSINVEAPLPKDMSATLQQLKKLKTS